MDIDWSNNLPGRNISVFSEPQFGILSPNFPPPPIINSLIRLTYELTHILIYKVPIAYIWTFSEAKKSKTVLSQILKLQKLYPTAT